MAFLVSVVWLGKRLAYFANKHERVSTEQANRGIKKAREETIDGYELRP
jgi:hypothetical protein